ADLAPDRPVEADELAAELRKARLQVSEYLRLQPLALALRQRLAGADQLVPPRAPPAPDLVPGLHHRSPRPPALRGPARDAGSGNDRSAFAAARLLDRLEGQGGMGIG